jgi:hypothetical protein
MKTAFKPAFLDWRSERTRLLVLIGFGIVAVFCVARFVVPTIYPDQTKVRTQFTAGTALPGAPARRGVHFGTLTKSSGERVRYAYVRIGSRVWIVERFITHSQP